MKTGKKELWRFRWTIFDGTSLSLTSCTRKFSCIVTENHRKEYERKLLSIESEFIGYTDDILGLYANKV